MVGAAVIVIIIVAAGGFYLMNSNKNPQTPLSNQVPAPSSPDVTETVVNTDTNSSDITVEGGEFSFTPSEITVKKGEKVKLTFKNTGSVAHDYVISDLNVSTKRIGPGKEETVEFTPQEAGEFEFICSVGNHEEQGMVGTLVVEE